MFVFLLCCSVNYTLPLISSCGYKATYVRRQTKTTLGIDLFLSDVFSPKLTYRLTRMKDQTMEENEDFSKIFWHSFKITTLEIISIERNMFGLHRWNISLHNDGQFPLKILIRI